MNLQVVHLVKRQELNRREATKFQFLRPWIRVSGTLNTIMDPEEAIWLYAEKQFIAILYHLFRSAGNEQPLKYQRASTAEKV